jgi:hypothetical protein
MESTWVMRKIATSSSIATWTNTLARTPKMPWFAGKSKDSWCTYLCTYIHMHLCVCTYTTEASSKQHEFAHKLTLAPRDELGPQGWTLAPRGEHDPQGRLPGDCSPLHSPPGVNTL